RMDEPDIYLGEWELIPELSLYPSGTPPAAGRYTIARLPDGTLMLCVRWQATEEADWQEVAFGGPDDGSPQLLPAASETGARVPDRFTLTRVDAGTLDSTATRGEHVLALARRVASRDGT